MTTVAQKVLNIVASPVGSLEWGSHRKELGLQKHIFSEESIGNPETVCLRDPITLRPKTITFSSPVVYGLSDVTFHPGLGILRASGIPIRESLPYYYNGPFLKGRERSRFTQGADVDATALTIQTNYYHFLLEDLPRLLLLRQEKKISRVYTGQVRLPSFVDEILGLFGIEIVVLRRTTSLKKVWFVARPGEGIAPTQWSVELLRSSFEVEDRPGTKRLFVSRRGAQRQFFDEMRFEDAVKDIGYESVSFENLTVKEQVEVAANAKVVVGPHGAGLSNQVFMSRGSFLVEIASDLYANHVFEVLAGDRLQFQRILIGSERRDDDQFQHSGLERLARLGE